MKKAFKILFIYIFYSIFGLLIGTAGYTLYNCVLNYVAGTPIYLFDMKIIKNAFYYIGACLVFYMTSVVSYSRIRYRGGFGQLIMFILVSFLSWGIVLPGILHHKSQYLQSPVMDDACLSSSYFRTADEENFYFIDSFEKASPACVVRINTSNEGGVDILSVKEESQLPLAEAAAPYKDVLISQIFKNNWSTKSLIDYRMLLNHGVVAFEKGWTFFLGFLSLAFILSSIYGLSNCFNWSLLNGCFVMLVTLCTLAFNSMFYTPLFNGFKAWKLCNIGIIRSLGNFVDEPLLVIINTFFGIVFCITGIIRFFVTRKAAKRGEI